VGTSPSPKLPRGAIERLFAKQGAANIENSVRITIFFSGISLLSLKPSEQGYISALVEKYYVLSNSFLGGGSLAQSGWVE
jgi:hypothetical protein